MGLVWIWLRIQTILGIRIQICLLSPILIWIPWILWWIPWILLRKIDCCNTNTGCGYLKTRQKPSTKCQNKQTYIYPELSVKKVFVIHENKNEFLIVNSTFVKVCDSVVLKGMYKMQKYFFFEIQRL